MALFAGGTHPESPLGLPTTTARWTRKQLALVNSRSDCAGLDWQLSFCDRTAKNATTTVPIVVTSVSDPARPAAKRHRDLRNAPLSSDPIRLQLAARTPAGSKTKIDALYNPSRFDSASQKSKLDSKASVLGLPAPLNYQPVDPNGSTQDAQIDKGIPTLGQQQFPSGDRHRRSGVQQSHWSDRQNVRRRAENPAGHLPMARVRGCRWPRQSYGHSLTLAYKLAGTYVGTHRLGAQPPSKSCRSCRWIVFELVINLKKPPKPSTITVPPTPARPRHRCYRVSNATVP